MGVFMLYSGGDNHEGRPGLRGSVQSSIRGRSLRQRRLRRLARAAVDVTGA